MINLMLCSLIYSADIDTATVEYVKKELTDSTTILKMTVPPDTEMYTCLDTKTYTRVIKTAGDLKYVNEQYETCQDEVSHYAIADSLFNYNMTICKESVDDVRKFNDELYTKLQEESSTKWYWIIGAFAAGAIVGSININLSN